MKQQLFTLSMSIVLLAASGCTKGGEPVSKDMFYQSILSEPETLHPIKSTDLYAREVQGFLMDSLMTRNSDTYEWEPLLAESYTISPDGKKFTFKIRKGCHFHDGTPITTEDIKFSIEAIKNPAFGALNLAVYYENIDKINILDDSTIEFTTKSKYFDNFNVVAGLSVIPKHVYEDPNKKGLNRTFVGSGPYKLQKYNNGQNIILEKNMDWCGKDLPQFKDMFNFKKVMLRFIKDPNIKVEMLKKGNIDYMEMEAETFAKKTSEPIWGTKVFKEQVENLVPKPYTYIGWNHKNELFKNKEVRRALSHLVNRKLMNEKFFYNLKLEATGPWYRQSPYADPNVKPIEFNPEEAEKLLAKNGWKDTDKDGVLDKTINGHKTDFKFTLVNSNPDAEKYLTVYKEDLKKAGIVMELKLQEWNSFLKLLDEKNFEAVRLGWGAGGIDNDPKQIWHSTSSEKGGSNYISYKNENVDKLIDKGRAELDREKRIKIYQEIYRKIADDAPYTFLFVDNQYLYGHTARVKFDKPTRKYGLGLEYWKLQDE